MRITMTFLLVLLLAPTTVAEELEDVVERALDATRAAREALSHGRGTGTYECKRFRLTGGKLESWVVERGTLSVAFSDGKDFMMFRATEGEPEYADRVYINDGTGILNSFFSASIRPFGADGRIYRLAKREVVYEPGMFGVAPHCLIHAFAYPHVTLEKLNGSGATLEKEDGTYVLQLDARSIGEAYLERFHIDPAKGHQISRHEITVFPENRVVQRVEKEWAQTEDGLWYVKSILDECLPRKERDTGASRRFDFEFFDTDLEIPEELFTVDALGLPPGARIIDNRAKPSERIIVQPPKTDLAILEKVVGRLPMAKPYLLRLERIKRERRAEAVQSAPGGP